MRYLITGGSGYIGGRLAALLAERDDTELVLGVDLRPPAGLPPRCEYVEADVRDRERIRELLEAREIDCLVHLAFLLNPIHDEARMYDIDVNGTQAVLQAAAAAGTGQVLVTSSATAYGAWPDNPVPIAEDWPVRGMPDFSYARHKAEMDRLCQLWAAEHPDRVMTIVRPCIVMGPNVENFISRIWTKSPFAILFDGLDYELQFVHEDDVVEAITSLLDAGVGGAFNIAGDGILSYRESAEMIGQRVSEMSLARAYKLYKILWALRFPGVEAPAGVVKTGRYPWLVSNEKLKAATGWQPRHTSRETFELAMRAKGKLRQAEDGSAVARLGAEG
ncbi:MAG: UDP-glucose 4-epimerase [Solirubrobacterales bacterium]|nr:UDP-glucose 4-epimerase [Solirubrobacterales bacterium]MDX6662003.1 UDP-glucose 4-epimerase [Solirubrobacterales bacterium]